MLVAVLSTASTHWPDVISVPIQYARDTAFYGDEAAAGGAKYQDFSRKVDGLVLQFCGSSPTELALAIVQAVIFGKKRRGERVGRRGRGGDGEGDVVERDILLTYIQHDLSPIHICKC